MQNYESERFARLLGSVAYNYGKSVDPIMIQHYWEALKSFSFKEVDRAFKCHACHPIKSDFMPRVGNLMRWLSGHPESRALQAWSKVCEAIHTEGCSDSVAFDDALIHATIHQMGGWAMLGQMTTKELPFRAQEFMKRYQYHIEEPPLRYPKYLMGSTEQFNRSAGYFEISVKLLGDPVKAENVIKNGGHSFLEARRVDGVLLKKLLKAPPAVMTALEKVCKHE